MQVICEIASFYANQRQYNCTESFIACFFKSHLHFAPYLIKFAV